MLSNPLVPFLLGLAAVVLFLVFLRLPAFLGLILATVVVGLATPEVPFAAVPVEVTAAFGDVMEAIGIPILMAAIIGKSLMDSGFWIVNEVAGLTQAETLKTWSAVNTVMPITGLVVVLLLATFVPLA